MYENLGIYIFLNLIVKYSTKICKDRKYFKKKEETAKGRKIEKKENYQFW